MKYRPTWRGRPWRGRRSSAAWLAAGLVSALILMLALMAGIDSKPAIRIDHGLRAGKS